MPKEYWKEVARDLSALGGIFIVNGFPNNSYSELEAKMDALGSLGAPKVIQVDPNIFINTRLLLFLQ